MATLEDKIMGEKLEYYCSSSEDEGPEEGGDSDDGAKGGKAKIPQVVKPELAQDMTHWQGNSANTGPKGEII
jgi:hypothetical protein